MQFHEVLMVVEAAMEAGLKVRIVGQGKCVIIGNRKYCDLLSALKAINNRTKE